MFQIIGMVVLVVVIVACLVWLFNSRAFNDFWGAGRAQVGKLGNLAWSSDPKAIMEQEIRDAQSELDRSISDLEEAKGMASELKMQVNSDLREVAKLDAKIKASLRDDPDDKGGHAAGYVMQLETARANAKRNGDQLSVATTMYANNLEKYRLATNKIKEAQHRARNIGVEIKSSETNAKLAKLAQKFNVDVSGLDSRLSAAESEARRQIARNNAVSEVQMDLGNDGLAEAREEERLKKAEAANKLDEYRKSMGLKS